MCFTIKKFDVGFTQVSNTILNDNQISLKAKGLYAYLFSKPDDWEFHISAMEKELKEKRDAILSTVNELIEHNYITRKQKNDGKFGGILYEFVLPHTENPHTENPYTDNPDTNNIYNNNKYNNIYNSDLTGSQKILLPQKKTRVKKQMIIPDKQEVIDFCKSLSLDGEKIYDYYKCSEVNGKWYDAKGEEVRNWKQKIRGVWDRPENKVKIALDKPTVGETEEDKEIIKDNIFIKNTTILARIKTGSLVLVNIMNELMRLANKEETAKKILETMRESELTDVQVEYIRKYLTSKITKV